MIVWKIEKRKISELKSYEKNPRKFTEKGLEDLEKSIKNCGDANIITINKDNTILGGHARLEVFKKLGYQEVDVKVPDHLLNEKEVQEVVIRLNSNIAGEWDLDKLQEEFDAMDLEEWGFEELKSLETDIPDEDIVEDDFEDPAIQEPKSKYGDIYQLGNHRLMCGDSTKFKDVEILMAGDIADMVLTDPPYNVNIENSQGMKIVNDNMSEENFSKFCDGYSENMSKFLKEGGSFYLWHADSRRVIFQQSLEKYNLTAKQNLIWVKNSFVVGRQDYKWQHEPCLYGWKDGASHYFVEEFNHATVFFENKPVKNDLHPTMKPIKILSQMIKNSSHQGELVLDLFGGSGSTMIACEETKRICYMMEYDPRYCDVIISRWEKLTGKKAKKIK